MAYSYSWGQARRVSGATSSPGLELIAARRTPPFRFPEAGSTSTSVAVCRPSVTSRRSSLLPGIHHQHGSLAFAGGLHGLHRNRQNVGRRCAAEFSRTRTFPGRVRNSDWARPLRCASCAWSDRSDRKTRTIFPLKVLFNAGDVHCHGLAVADVRTPLVPARESPGAADCSARAGRAPNRPCSRKFPPEAARRCNA